MENITISNNLIGTLPFFVETPRAEGSFKMINKAIAIEAPIEKVWQIVGKEFADAYKWGASLKHSEALDTATVNGSSCSIRGCDVEGFGNIKEELLHYSDDRHELSYVVTEGMPKMVKYAANSWRLKALPNGQTEVQMQMKMETVGFIGAIMRPLMIRNFSKLLAEITEELKYYVEEGKPHPRKIKAIAKK